MPPSMVCCAVPIKRMFNSQQTQQEQVYVRLDEHAELNMLSIIAVSQCSTYFISGGQWSMGALCAPITFTGH